MLPARWWTSLSSTPSTIKDCLRSVGAAHLGDVIDAQLRDKGASAPPRHRLRRLVRGTHGATACPVHGEASAGAAGERGVAQCHPRFYDSLGALHRRYDDPIWESHRRVMG